jgi:hypothetical protein
MSTIIMSQCWPLQGMTPAQKAVLVSLADNANDQGVCWPSVESIAMRTCLSERSVQNSIKWLIEQGALHAQQRNGRSTVYTVTPAAFAPPQQLRGANKDETPANNDRTPAAFAPTPATAAPRTVNEPSRNRKEPSNAGAGKKSKQTDDIDVELPDWLPADAWADWVEHRREIKAPLTQRAAELSVKTLAKLKAQGNNPVEVIEQSVLSGKWTALYPVKDRHVGQAGSAKQHMNFDGKNYREGIGDDGRF